MKDESQRKVKAFDRFKIVAALAFGSFISFIQLGFPVGEGLAKPIFIIAGVGFALEAMWQFYIAYKGSN